MIISAQDMSAREIAKAIGFESNEELNFGTESECDALALCDYMMFSQADPAATAEVHLNCICDRIERSKANLRELLEKGAIIECGCTSEVGRRIDCITCSIHW
jgi:hypothetical protein